MEPSEDTHLMEVVSHTIRGHMRQIAPCCCRVMYVRVHALWGGLSCGMLFVTTHPVSHADPQEDACLRRPQNSRRT